MDKKILDSDFSLPRIKYWNYRVVHRTFTFGSGTEASTEEFYFIAEIYYNENDEIIFYVTEDGSVNADDKIKAMAPCGIDSVKDLLGCLNKMKQAIKRPVLEYDELLKIGN